MKTAKLVAKLLGLLIAYLVLFLGGVGALGPPVDRSAMSAADQASSGQMALAVALIDLGILGAWVARARFGGWRLWATAVAVFYGVKTFSSQLETAWFVKSAHIPPEMLPNLFAMTLPLCVIWPALLVLALGPRAQVEATAPARVGADLWLRVFAAGALLYPFLFFLFGYEVAWQNAAVRAYYEGPAVPLPLVEHFARTFSADPLVVPFEMARGLLWVGLGWLTWRATRAPWWSGVLLYALMMVLVQNDLHLLPNPLMPDEVRHWHFIETSTSNFLFALGAGLLLRPPRG